MGFAGPGTMPFVAYNQDFSRILAIAGNGGSAALFHSGGCSKVWQDAQPKVDPILMSDEIIPVGSSSRLLLPLAIITCLTHCVALGETNFIRLKSFGYPEKAASCPTSGLTIGRDGFLYGTSYDSYSDSGAVFKLNRDGSFFALLHRFLYNSLDANGPSGGLIEASDGALYGTAQGGGGSVSNGAVFAIQKDGSNYRLLHVFSAYDDGAAPGSSLIEGSDRNLYGTTVLGGRSGKGTVFRLAKDGTGFQALRHFQGVPFGDGANPRAPLIEGPGRTLFGTTQSGGSGYGTIYKLNSDGSNYLVLHRFANIDGDGTEPYSGLALATDGRLYGTTVHGGGANSYGTIFRLNVDGSGYSVLHRFTGYPNDGYYAYNELLEGQNGHMYGTTRVGGAMNGGAVFSISKDSSEYSLLHSFQVDGLDGIAPASRVVQDSSGRLYGATSLGGLAGQGAVFELNADGSDYAVAWYFSATGGDGMNPFSDLCESDDGVLYGTTFSGGAGCGTVFKLNKDGGRYQVLHYFSCPDAADKVIVGRDGELFGINSDAIFKLGVNGDCYAIVHTFTGAVDERASPNDLIQCSDGTLCGTTRRGGAANQGTIFKVERSGSNFMILHSFLGGVVDGAFPNPIVEADDGILYGTTVAGGTNDGGTVFRISTNGNNYTLLRHFAGSDGDGRSPAGQVIESADGSLYATTSRGGCMDNGTLFRLNKDGSGYTLLHVFTGGQTDGRTPRSGLARSSDGSLYGTTTYGGPNDKGTVFELDAGGTSYRVAYYFPDTVGFWPNRLTVDPSGDLYGTTQRGGEMGLGTVFVLSPAVHCWFTRSTKDRSGSVSLDALGAAGVAFRLQFSTNFAASVWSGLATNVANGTGLLKFVDPQTELMPCRFYRLAAP